MKVIVEGMVMETLYEAEKDSRGVVIGQKPYFRIYQKGEKSMIDIKKIPADISYLYAEGSKVAFSCKVFPWKTEDGTINLSLSFTEDFTRRFYGSDVRQDNASPLPTSDTNGDKKK